MIESRYNTDFTVFTRLEAKVDGRLLTTYTEDLTTYRCAIFTPTSQRFAIFGKKQFAIEKNLYCSVDTPIVLGDYIVVDGGGIMTYFWILV